MDDNFKGTQRFELVGRLGEGATGIVYEAYDRKNEETVALKVLRTLNADTVLHLKNEFRALQDLQHPNLVSYGELIEDVGRWFFTMELINGVSFVDYVRKATIGQKVGVDDLMADTALNLPTAQEAAMIAASDPVSMSREEMRAVPRRASFDEAKLRDVFAQLASALAEFHRSGQVHRDVKPSNFMVTRDGRGVLLDFGLVTDVARTGDRGEQRVVGTVAYMAPEQGASKPVGPEADCYSAGVLLYEALTGQLPFVGRTHKVLMDKQRIEPPPPSDLVVDLPADLDRLCRELLRFDPRARPTAQKILERLGHPGERRTRDLSLPASASQSSVFVGRERELIALEVAYQRTRSGTPLTFLISGESGMGKTSLVRQFTARIDAEDPGPIILSGRCYERESVPYKAVDGVVDALGRFLVSFDLDAARELIPASMAWAAQVFPVLRRLEVVSQAPEPDGVADPQERRTRMFAALREVFARICVIRPVVMVIDDIQWADGDSLALLSEILRAPDAPPLLFIATMQMAAANDSAKIEGQAAVDLALHLGCELEHLHLEQLSREQARALADKLLRRGGGGPISASQIVDEAGGHPLFIDELVRHNLTIDDPEDATTRLDVAIRARIDSLEAVARRVLQVVSMSLAPLSQEVVAVAGAIPKGTFTRTVALLRVAHLIRTAGTRSADTVEPYHGRIRDAVVGGLSQEERIQCHRRLALALESGWQVDPEAVAVHLSGAGEYTRAALKSEEAGDNAIAALAFGRAAALFSSALQLGKRAASTSGEVDLSRTRGLHVKLGHAHAAAGRGGEAAKCYLRASKGASAAGALELRRLAAEQLLRSGRIRSGLATLGSVLKELGIVMPRTPTRSLIDLAWRRAHLRLRGLGYKEHDESQIADDALRRIDICWSASAVMGMVDTIRGAGFQSRHLLLALRVGEPIRVARAFVSEGAFVAAASPAGFAKARRLLHRALEIGTRLDDPYVVALAIGVDGLVHFLNGKWTTGHECCASAEKQFREKCINVAWELHNANLFRLSNLFYLGELGELCELVPYYLAEAQDRGDRYAGTNLRQGLPCVWHLVRDAPEELRAESTEAIRSWSHEGFYSQHYWDLFAQATAHLYEGNGPVAWRCVIEAWTPMVRSMLLRVQIFRIIAWDLRGRAAIAAATQDAGMLVEAKKAAAKLEREELDWAGALAAVLRAAIAAREGRREVAVGKLRAAIDVFRARQMALHVSLAEHQLGLILGGDEGAALRASTDAWMKEQGVLQPAKLAGCFLSAVQDTG